MDTMLAYYVNDERDEEFVVIIDGEDPKEFESDGFKLAGTFEIIAKDPECPTWRLPVNRELREG